MEQEYIVQAGDTFFQLAQRWGGTCCEWQLANPHLDPEGLQVGQKISLPITAGIKRGQGSQVLDGTNHFTSAGRIEGKDFSGENLDEIEMDLAGIQFKVRRVGESKIPHEIHVLLPRAEIRKIQPSGEGGPCELQVILSNVDIVHSPRLTSEGGVTIAAATGKRTNAKTPRHSAAIITSSAKNTASGSGNSEQNGHYEQFNQPQSQNKIQNQTHSQNQYRQGSVTEEEQTLFPDAIGEKEQRLQNMPVRWWKTLFKRR